MTKKNSTRMHDAINAVRELSRVWDTYGAGDARCGSAEEYAHNQLRELAREEGVLPSDVVRRARCSSMRCWAHDIDDWASAYVGM